jgi:hypothetical protein
MVAWRIILQLESTNAGSSACDLYDAAGVSIPVQICVVACDAVAERAAAAVHAEIAALLSALPASTHPCRGGPRDLTCVAWSEPACRHVLLLLIGAACLSPSYEGRAKAWLQQRGGDAKVITALVPPLTHTQIFDRLTYPLLASCQAATWGGAPRRLAAVALTEALLDEKPGVFISYLRTEASGSADALYDGLTHAGYRVFLDRFNGTPGRVFPRELAEAMSSMGLVVLLETTSTLSSKWTMWEAVFAQRFRLGPIALNFSGAPPVMGVTGRTSVPQNAARVLSPKMVQSLVEYIEAMFLKTAVARQTHFEVLVRSAARSRGGDATEQRGGILSITDRRGAPAGCVLPTAVPGRLRHIGRLARSGYRAPHVLAGEHQHLMPNDLEDLRWLATKTAVKLCGSASVYRVVRRMV